VKKRILVAVVCVPVLIAALLLLPEIGTACVVGLISVISAYEMTAAAEPEKDAEKNYPLLIISMFASMVVTLFVYRFNDIFTIYTDMHVYGIFYFFVGAAAGFAVEFVLSSASAFRKEEDSDQPGVMYAIMGGAVIPLFLSAILALRMRPNGKFYVLLPFIVAFITDAGAYFTGLLFGKHKAFPRVSPKKTVEGCIGGFVIGVAATLAYGVIVKHAFGRDVSFLSLALCGLIGAIATEGGDFIFSLIKRERGIKDFGNLLPGHGGMLDRFDSMVLAAPAVFLIILVFPAFR
jgi:phosphatidate cytidylyltransferase